MKTTPRHDQSLFDNLIIRAGQGGALVLAGIAVFCASIVLYGFFDHIIYLAS